MDDFEELLDINRSSVERYVRFRLNSKTDSDDVLQEVYMTAYQKFGQLKNKDSFKAWIISIARNKCNDYFHDKANCLEIPVDQRKVKCTLIVGTVSFSVSNYQGTFYYEFVSIKALWTPEITIRFFSLGSRYASSLLMAATYSLLHSTTCIIASSVSPRRIKFLTIATRLSSLPSFLPICLSSSAHSLTA